VIALLLWSGRAAPWTIAFAAFWLGTAWAIDWPTRRSLVQVHVVGMAHLGNEQVAAV
jgi:hypothetical protein